MADGDIIHIIYVKLVVELTWQLGTGEEGVAVGIEIGVIRNNNASIANDGEGKQWNITNSHAAHCVRLIHVSI